jgi:predicted membrane metal-binding protein
MFNKSEIKISSNRNFGLVFFFVFLIVSLWPLINEGSPRYWSIVIAVIFLILGLLNSKLLTPLNKLWFKFGLFLGFIISPIIMGIIFFLVIAPTGLVMKLMGKDLLDKKYDNKKKSYWINRTKTKNTMKQQF